MFALGSLLLIAEREQRGEVRVLHAVDVNIATLKMTIARAGMQLLPPMQDVQVEQPQLPFLHPEHRLPRRVVEHARKPVPRRVEKVRFRLVRQKV